MRWMKTFTLVMKSNLTALAERFEDPERMLHQLLVDMEDELARVRAGVARALADEIQLERTVAGGEREVARWGERAEAALRRSADGEAKAALERKLRAEDRLEGLRLELLEMQAQTGRLREAVSGLEAKIRQARHQRTLLLARLLRAESGRRIQETLKMGDSGSAFAEFERLEARVQRSEAMSEAYDRLDGRDSEADALDRDFEARERAEKLDRELRALRARLQDGAA